MTLRRLQVSGSVGHRLPSPLKLTDNPLCFVISGVVPLPLLILPPPLQHNVEAGGQCYILHAITILNTNYCYSDANHFLPGSKHKSKTFPAYFMEIIHHKVTYTCRDINKI